MESKRVTLQLKCPNPLFGTWIQEMYMTAVKNGSKSQHNLNIALKSIKRYPLELKSGAECGILKGFGKNLCQILDKKLERYKQAQVKLSEKPVLSSKRTPTESLKRNFPQSPEIPIADNAKKLKSSYVPGYKTGAYAILITLLMNLNKAIESMSKTDIQTQAQVHCDESFTKIKPGSFYNAWSSMKTLITKGYVTKEKKKILQYSLTEQGSELAKAILLQSEKVRESESNENILFNTNSNDPTANINQSEHSKVILPHYIPHIANSNNRLECEVVSLNVDHISEDFLPNSFDILLLVDKQETSGTKNKDDVTIMTLNKFTMIRYELRHLKVGDFTWIARHRETGKELVLPHIVERKRIDDLAGSIRDGRFHEQKFRLKQCGLPGVIYLVESYGNNQRTGLPLSTLMQAVVNTRVQEGFMTHFTKSLSDSIKFLAMMTKHIGNFYASKRLTTRSKNEMPYSDSNSFALMEFNHFNAMASKTKTLTVKDMFIKQLLQLKGVSVEKAVAIASTYQTPSNLIHAFKNCDSDKKPELLLANIKYGLSRSNIGPQISKILYQFFTKEVLV